MAQPEPQTKPTILVVDDAPDQVSLLVGLLTSLYRVQVATDGDKALDLAARSPQPDLILLDVMLPNIDGFALCRALKAEPSTREIPVLFLTSRSDTQDEARGFAAGGADYITKPFSPPLVLARIRTHLQQRRLLASERQIMEQTLKGALGTIIEMLSMSDPEAWAWNQRLGDLAERVAEQLGLEEPWMVGLAGVLSRIGTLAVPEALLAKVKAKGHLNSLEREAVQRIPEVGYRLLRTIPRLEEVAEMVYFAQKGFNGQGFPPESVTGEDIPVGARILKVCTDFLPADASKEDPRRTVSDMLTRLSSYDARVVLALKAVVETGYLDPVLPAEEAGAREVEVGSLMEGQVLAADVVTTEGQVLLRDGTELKASHIEKLCNFAMIGAVPGLVSVR